MKLKNKFVIYFKIEEKKRDQMSYNDMDLKRKMSLKVFNFKTCMLML